MSRQLPSLEERLWARVVKGRPNECWPWVHGGSGSEYGCIWRDGRPVGTHRVAWEVTNGPIPDGVYVCHTCDNPPCCNPAHLFLGTPADNAADREAKGRSRNPVGLRNGNARLTPDEVAEIRRRYIAWTHPSRRTGASSSELAGEFGITQSYVLALVAHQWRKSA